MTITLTALEVNALQDLLSNLSPDQEREFGDYSVIQDKLYRSLDVITDSKYDDRVIFTTAK